MVAVGKIKSNQAMAKIDEKQLKWSKESEQKMEGTQTSKHGKWEILLTHGENSAFLAWKHNWKWVGAYKSGGRYALE